MVTALRVFQKVLDEGNAPQWGFTLSGCEKQLGTLVPTKPETFHRFGDGFPAATLQDGPLGQLALHITYERGFIRTGDQPDSIDVDRRIGGRGNRVIPSGVDADTSTVKPPPHGEATVPSSTPADGEPLGSSAEDGLKPIV